MLNELWSRILSLRIAVICGGPSLEHDISLAAGEACSEALRLLKYDVHLVLAEENLPECLSSIRPDVAFNALHGRWGEDGCVQGIFEWMKIPYTHSGVLASAMAMDKQRSKIAYHAAGVPTPESRLMSRADIGEAHAMAPPYIVKPHNEGSSLGGFFLIEEGDDPPVIPSNSRDVFMIEAFVPGRELTVAVLDGKAIAVSEFDIGKWYDFNSKYTLSDANRILPAKLPPDIYDRCLDLAERAHNGLGCRGISRTDIRWDESLGADGLFALETNTQPGLRPNSNAGQQAACIGMSFPDLCDFLVKDASLDR